MSAFRESARTHPRSQLLLNSEHAQSRDSKLSNSGSVSHKPETINEDGAYDIDIATCIVGDLSSDIFSNIEKLNLCEKYKDDTITEGILEELDQNKTSHNVSLHIEDETECIKVSERNKNCDTDSKTNADQEQFKTEMTLLERRRVSLPEITTIPNLNAKKIK